MTFIEKKDKSKTCENCRKKQLHYYQDRFCSTKCAEEYKSTHPEEYTRKWKLNLLQEKN